MLAELYETNLSGARRRSAVPRITAAAPRIAGRCPGRHVYLCAAGAMKRPPRRMMAWRWRLESGRRFGMHGARLRSAGVRTSRRRRHLRRTNDKGARRPPVNIQDEYGCRLAVADVHRDFEAKTDIAESRGFPGHVHNLRSNVWLKIAGAHLDLVQPVCQLRESATASRNTSELSMC